MSATNKNTEFSSVLKLNWDVESSLVRLWNENSFGSVSAED